MSFSIRVNLTAVIRGAPKIFMPATFLELELWEDDNPFEGSK
jgi:hypothetical protein